MTSCEFARTAENGTWGFSPLGWRQLYGSFPNHGISLEWHDFEIDHALSWERSFHENSMEICLNLEGNGEVHKRKSNTIQLKNQTVGIYVNRNRDLQANRAKNEKHTFLTIELSQSYLQRTLAQPTEGLLPIARSFLSSKSGNQLCPHIQPLTTSLSNSIIDLRNPPVPEQAWPLWFQSKTLEILSHVLFEEKKEEEFFCMRQKRVAHERIDKVKRILTEKFDHPLSLINISKQVGCSPFYLSRTFSQETGTTIPKYLRQIRIEQAARLLKTGHFNVTEAAMEVGYSSSSHFTKAFHEVMGCCPGLYPIQSLQKSSSKS